MNSVFNNSALPPRNWLSSDVTLSRLSASLGVLASGHLNCASKPGTYLQHESRCAVPATVELFLDELVRRFTLSISTNFDESTGDVSLDSIAVPSSEVNTLGRTVTFQGANNFKLPGGGYSVEPPSLNDRGTAKRGDYCLLHADRVAVPLPGQAATACLEEILGRDSSVLQPVNLIKPEALRDGLPLPASEGLTLPPSLTRKVSARAHAHPGEWKRVVTRMKAAGMCVFEDVGCVYENSVFGVLKTSDNQGAHRLIFSGDMANHFFAAESGAVELPNPDVLSQIHLQQGQKLYLASTDISQCYNRLRVPIWLRRYLGMPRVRSRDVGEKGPDRWLIPVLTVLPMGIIPAVRLCQAVTMSLCKRTLPCRSLSLSGPFEISSGDLPLDIVYLDDLTSVGTDLAAVNARRDAIAKTCAEHGLPEELAKAVYAVEGQDGEALGLLFRQSGLLSVTPKFLYKLLRATEELLVSRQCSSRHLAQVIGCWVYACLLKRPMLSVLSAVYDFCDEARYDEVRLLPDAVLRELSILLDLAPAMCCNLAAPVSGRVYATDACPTGSGVTYLDNVSAAERSLLSESKVRKNWQASLQTRPLTDDSSELSSSGPLMVSTEFTKFFE